MIPATAERANGTQKSVVIAGSIVYDIVISDANQIDIHQTQVNKYPKVVEGGKRFQILFLRPSKMTSIVNSLASLYVAKARTIN
jgi:hypothetical protein